MFGKKKEISEKYISKLDEEINDDPQNSPKKDRAKNISQGNARNSFIFCGSDNMFKPEIEIYFILKEYSNQVQDSKRAIAVDRNSSIKFLSSEICESFSKLPEYQDLEGLNVILSKIDEEKNLPSEAKVIDFLKNGDIVYVNLDSNEIWTSVNIKMTNMINKIVNVSMDIKIKNESSFRELRYKILKEGINYFLDKDNKNSFHYIISKFNITHSAHGKIDEIKLKTIENMKIKQLFKFKDKLNIYIEFNPLEFILFKRLKTISIPQKEKVNKRKSPWEKFKNLQFRELLTNKMYIKEKNYIFSYIKDIFSDKIFTSNCYIYSLDNNNTLDTTDKFFDDDKKEDKKDLSTLNINNSNDSESIEFDKDARGRNRSFFSKFKTLGSNFSNSTIIVEEQKIGLIVVPQNERGRGSWKNDDYIVYKSKNYSSRNLAIFKDEKKEENDEIIIYKDLKPRQNFKKPSPIFDAKIKVCMSHRNDLCSDFVKYFDKSKFIEFICSLFKMNIKKGCLEKTNIPIIRNLKIKEKEIGDKNNKKRKKRKKKKNKDIGIFSVQVYPIKRLNFEIGIFSFFILAIFIFLSFLLSYTYY